MWGITGFMKNFSAALLIFFKLILGFISKLKEEDG